MILKNRVALALMAIFFLGSMTGECAGAAAVARPTLVAGETRYNFGKVDEGLTVSHEFVIANRGSLPLRILKIESGCGCTAATSVRQIPPGQEGRIEVKINTSGYGGQTIRETVRIQTNDPDRPWISVSVTGLVEKIVDIRPERIRLAGTAGQSLSAEVVITPRADIPLKITKVMAKNGNFIEYQWTQRCTAGTGRCVLRVTNTRKEKGRYVDALYLFTDSDLRPTIPIFIIGIIR